MKKIIVSLCTAAVVAASLGTALPAVAASPNYTQNQRMHHPRFEPHGNYAYYNGQRGDRHFHRGWRLYNGYYFPPAAFAAAIGGAILGTLLNAH